MVKQIDIMKLNEQLTSVLENISNGEEYIVVQDKTAVAKLVGLSSKEKIDFESNHSGQKWTEDDFDIHLSDEV